jgi:hypothetical protein
MLLSDKSHFSMANSITFSRTALSEVTGCHRPAKGASFVSPRLIHWVFCFI